MGTMASRDPAIITGKLVLNCPRRVASPEDKVIMLISVFTISGHIRSPYDAYKEVYCDMMEFGIVDPTKVTRSALENASSIASVLLTTESLVADKPQPAAAAAPAGEPGMPAGMY